MFWTFHIYRLAKIVVIFLSVVCLQF